MELTLSGVKYTSAKLDLRTQFHIMRRIGPAVAKLGGAGPKPGEPRPEMSPTVDLSPGGLRILESIATALSEMKESDADYVLDKCLSIVRRQDGGVWVPIQAENGRMMFEDIDLPDMLRLVASVLQEALGRFFSKLER